jgi:hypothetical protein
MAVSDFVASITLACLTTVFVGAVCLFVWLFIEALERDGASEQPPAPPPPLFDPECPIENLDDLLLGAAMTAGAAAAVSFVGFLIAVICEVAVFYAKK